MWSKVLIFLQQLIQLLRNLRAWLWARLSPLLARLLAPFCRYEVETLKGRRLVWDFYPLVMAGFTLLFVAIIIYVIRFSYSSEGARYRAAAERVQREKRVQDLPLRGSILASDERPVAVTTPVYRLGLDFLSEPLKVLYAPLPTGKTHQDSLERAKYYATRQELDYGLDRLAVLIDSIYDLKAHGLSRQQLKARWRKGLEQRKRGLPVINLDVSYQQYQILMASSPFAPKIIKNKRVPSLLSKMIISTERTKRIYPFGSLAYRTIGQLQPSGENNISKGKSGLELRYDDLLRGRIGSARRVYYGNSYRRIVDEPALDGADIVTNLDMDIQSIVEHSLREQLQQLEAESGTVVLMEVKTGKIVAISNLEQVKRSPGTYSESINMAMTNKAEPGSTFKVASMMVALDDGIVRPNDTIDVGNGLWPHEGRVVRDHNAGKGGYGRISVAQTIIKSSNVGVAKIIVKGYKDKPDEYVEKIRRLGFGFNFQKEVDLQGVERASIRKRSDNPNRWYNTTLAWMSYGYETQIPPIYTLAFFNAIANGGRYMRPYFVSEIRRRDSLTQHIEPKVLKEQICKPETLQAIQEMLRRVVTEGTGKKARSAYVAISGKSGTAQLSGKHGYRDSLGQVRHQVSFCAYFPSEAPRYSCIAVIRAPSARYSAGGGVMAAPIIRRIAESLVALEKPRPLDSLPRSASPLAYTRHIAAGRTESLLQLLEQMGLPTPQLGSKAPAYIRIDSAAHISALPLNTHDIPDLRGMSAMDAVYLLRSRGYRVQLVGAGNVVSQSIPAGTAAARGSEIVLQLGYEA
ncbi:penicillin-binding protein [Porphyromonas sp. oral taxon 275]|uniref:penicillin-binding protein n=1 Tax=Porphyromonas sp. oral taxon 275 TaxID=712435 RepID=UPI001BA53103|nr:penicillin-binding protein [Porphyromonas sp. oral taxon 275]QUB42458.1 transpeptidase family protein [Porphyromonas sp. oral taxon 275]